MSSPVVEVHPDAVVEARAARAWYDDRSPALGNAFVAELDRAIERIVESPQRWPKIEPGSRRYLMRRFPFMVVYRQTGEAIQIVAVAHGRRKPGYWRSR